jgi:FAD/FMN-containing dehydrogenase
MAQLTRDLIAATVANGGRFFLPYQLHYDAADLVRSYPEVGEFFAVKRRYDPDGVFSNTFYAKYSTDV